MRKCILVLLSFFVIAQSNAQTKTKSVTKKSKETLVEVTTNQGKMVFKLYNETPLHKANFIKLVKEEFYKDLLFHRIIKDFMVQGGDPESRNAAPQQALGNGGPGYTIPAEFNSSLIHKKGALAAARMGDFMNPKKESSGSQFYIVQGRKLADTEIEALEYQSGAKYTIEQKNIYKTLGGTPFLDRNYSVFGEIVSGIDVLDKIARVSTQPGDRPVEDIKFTIKMLK